MNVDDVKTEILCEVMIIVPGIEYTDDDDPKPYPITRVYRYDIESSALTHLLLEAERLAIEGGKMRNE